MLNVNCQLSMDSRVRGNDVINPTLNADSANFYTKDTGLCIGPAGSQEPPGEK
jgi:hypothetical protein